MLLRLIEILGKQPRFVERQRRRRVFCIRSPPETDFHTVEPNRFRELNRRRFRGVAEIPICNTLLELRVAGKKGSWRGGTYCRCGGGCFEEVATRSGIHG